MRNEIEQDRDFIIMYHGAVTRGRGIETLIDVVSVNPYIKLFILGDGTKEYINNLKQNVAKKASDRVAFHPAVPHKELWKYVGAADVGMITIPAVCQSYYYMLPNKLLENIQCLTPVIGSDFPEIRKIINGYGIGLLCDPSDVNKINDCIEKMRIDKAFYNACKRNLLSAKKELCWEKEKHILELAVLRYLKQK